MNRSLKVIAWTALSVVLGASSCNRTVEDNFDRAGLLQRSGNEMILPTYQQLASDMEALHLAMDSLTTTPTSYWVQQVRAAHVTAYKQWQHCKAFEFGPAADIALRSSLSTYPTDTVLIESNISSGAYDLGTITNRVAIGFPALDYLLYHVDEGTLMLELTTAPGAAARKQYLMDLVSKMKTEVNTVASQWQSSYLSTFTSDDGNTSTSPITFLFNAFIQDYELIKNAKLGIPLGVDNAGVSRPGYAEAPFSGISLELIRENVESIQDIFMGRNPAGVDGTGFDDYADDRDAQYSGQALSDAIQNGFAAIYAKIDALSDPVHVGVDSDWQSYYSLYQEIKNLVALLKTDLASSTSILITYQDNDGD